MRSILYFLLKVPVLGKLLLLLKVGRQKEYLAQMGWFASARSMSSVDQNGKPLAWFTYSFLNFVEPRLTKDITVYEFGSGNGTLWWADRVKEVTAMEHHAGWAEKISATAPKNVTILQENLPPEGAYASALKTAKKKYDIIIIDGRVRNACSKSATTALTKRGIIVWDNSERPGYQEGLNAIVEQGFKRLDFWGIGPINSTISCTSVLYRAENVLDI